jgi:leucine rich repeat (LRR) protein
VVSEDGPPRTFHGPKDYLDLAQSPDVTPDELRELAKSAYPFVRQAVAEHPRTPRDALAALLPAEPSDWNDFTLVATVARHAHADEPLLRAIADRLGLHRLREDRDSQRVFEAGIALFEQPRTPEDVLLGLLNDAGATTEFRKVAARQTTHQAVIEQLLTDRSESVRRAAGRRVSDL